MSETSTPTPAPADEVSQAGSLVRECLGRWAHRRIAVWDPPIGVPGARLTNRWRCTTCGQTGVEPPRGDW